MPVPKYALINHWR